MNASLILVLALTGLGASAASILSTGHCGTGFNHLSGPYEPTVSETVVTPFHRTDSVAGPCGQCIVHTKSIPATTVGHYGFTGAHGLAGSGLGLAGAGHSLTGLGFLSGAHGCGYPNALTGGFVGASFGGFNGGIGSTFSGPLGGAFGSPIIGTGLGVANGGTGVLGSHFTNAV